MRPGELIAERFEIEQRVGTGGMGEVYRALDVASGEKVAVKLLHHEHASSALRFIREAEVLAELSHPGIVRHIAHGLLASGAPYLVMEWLSGEDLGTRLARRALSVDETITLVARAAEALAAVHARGVVHRDLKPSNIFLEDLDVSRVKLLDFGIARLPEASRMTMPGALLGTPGYMAPELARSAGEIDARGDVFSLGCVIYECLTGRVAFTGTTIMAVLAKILFAEVPRAQELRPEVPPLLDALVARMLAKDPELRPRDGAAVAAVLDALEVASTLPGSTRFESASGRPSALTQKERRVLSVVLVSPAAPSFESAVPKDVAAQIAARGGHLELLADGSITVTLVGTGIATDQAAQAARCALVLRDRLEGRRIALVTSRAELHGRLPTGDLIDTGARMLAEGVPALGRVKASIRAAPIAIDEVTAGLLDAHFEVVETRAGHALLAEQVLAVGARTLLGKATTCVGRDHELDILRSLFTECVEEPMAQAVLVTAPAGMGKTRLAHELVSRVRKGGERVAVWIGRGDPLAARGAFGLLGQALAGACGIRDGEPLDLRKEKLLLRVAKAVGEQDARRVAEFLGEIVGTPFPDEDSAPLRAARKDAQLMGGQMRHAFLDFLAAVSAAEPLILLLEDLQWGDPPSVQFIDAALRRLKEAPFMVLALARPEVHTTFPKLWFERHTQEIRLRELSPKASARLVQQVLGDRVSGQTAQRLVAQADGNAFYLEEVIRKAAEGSGEALPETVLSMVQSRLESLDGAARRLLRAASVFGAVFWRGAVEALIGGGEHVPSLDAELSRLEKLEWIYARQEARFQGERELCFRHGLVREAAYGMLTDEDRALGHRLAGEWLEAASEPSAAVIAEHFDRGGDSARAIGCYQRAAAQALAGNDFRPVLSWTERAFCLGASGATRGQLALLRVEAYRWRGELDEAARWADEAMAMLPKGSAAWYQALGGALEAIGRLGQQDRLAALADELKSARPEEQAETHAVIATARMARHLFAVGLYDRAEAQSAGIEAVAARLLEDPIVSGFVSLERMLREQLAGQLDGSRAHAEAAIASFDRAGDLRHACAARIDLGYEEIRLGAYAEAARLLRAAIADAERMGLEHLLARAWMNLGLVLDRLGEHKKARAEVVAAVAAFAARGDRRPEGAARVYLAGNLQRAGALAEAEAEARRAVDVLSVIKPLLVLARGTLADVLLARGRATEALVEARDAIALLASLGKAEDGEALARVVLAEALFATGDHAAARAAIAEAHRRLLAAAARIEDPSRQRAFLENVPENARTLSLARAWLGEAARTL